MKISDLCEGNAGIHIQNDRNTMKIVTLASFILTPNSNYE